MLSTCRGCWGGFLRSGRGATSRLCHLRSPMVFSAMVSCFSSACQGQRQQRLRPGYSGGHLSHTHPPKGPESALHQGRDLSQQRERSPSLRPRSWDLLGVERGGLSSTTQASGVEAARSSPSLPLPITNEQTEVRRGQGLLLTGQPSPARAGGTGAELGT
jgi:hypothetical protein